MRLPFRRHWRPSYCAPKNTNTPSSIGRALGGFRADIGSSRAASIAPFTAWARCTAKSFPRCWFSATPWSCCSSPALAATAYMYIHVPTGFVPQEDQNYFIVVVQAPPGASLSYTTDIAKQAEEILRADPDVFGTFAVPGFSLSGGSSSNYGLIFAPLKPIDDRKGKGHAASDIVARVSPKLFGIPGAIVVAFEPPAIQGIGSFGGFQFQLQDLGRNTLEDLDTCRAQDCRRQPPAQRPYRTLHQLHGNDPQQLVQIDREKAKAIGVPINQMTQALGVYMGSEYVNDFDFNNRSYRVYVQADQPFRMNARDLRQYYVRSDTNGLVPLDNLVSLKETAGPQVINHFNLFRSAEIDGLAAPGFSSSEGLKAMEDLAKQNMLQGMSFSWSGLALEEVEAGGKAIIIFGLGLLVVYLTLSAQYESFALPFIILLAVPMAVLGALLFVFGRGLVDDIYVQIGLVLLIGLSAKNSILIVEFAEQLIERGRSITEAAIEAAELRLRPILMTSFAFILGVLPLYFATGAGKLGRHSVGTAIVGGMLFSTMLNLFFIPVLYVILKTWLVKMAGGNPRKSSRPGKTSRRDKPILYFGCLELLHPTSSNSQCEIAMLSVSCATADARVCFPEDCP